MTPKRSTSPFSGMDPYLEEPAFWPAFHRQLVACLHSHLLPNLVDRYSSVSGNRHYTTGTTEHQEDYLEVRQRSNGQLITLLDVVSPANKTTPAGREAYLGQRRKALEAKANVVEIDLVLQGQPTLEYSRDGLPEWDYAVTVQRLTHAERFEIYPATLQKRLPRFRLPLASDDRDAVLDLQGVFTRCYAEIGCFSRIDYRRDPPVSLSDEDRWWLDATLAYQGLREPTPLIEDIAIRAYYIWLNEGCPHGRDKEHWLMALVQLQEESRAAASAKYSP